MSEEPAEHVDLVGEFCGAIDADALGRLDSGVTGNVPMVVELHGFSSLRCGRTNRHGGGVPDNLTTEMPRM